MSKIFSRRSAAHEPIAIDNGIERAAERKTSTPEFTSRGPSNFVTGCWAASDVPRSPWSSPFSQSQYWLTIGLAEVQLAC